MVVCCYGIHKRRIINEELLKKIYNQLLPTGWIRIATDSKSYSEWIEDIIKNSLFKTNNNYKIIDRTTTKYETRGLELNHKINEYILIK